MPVHVTFLFPVAAWLFALLPLLWWSARRPWRHGRIALRAAVVACAILAMTQPSPIRRAGDPVRVYVIDQRPQIGGAAQARARAILARLLARVPRAGRDALVQLGGAPIAAWTSPRTMIVDGSLSTALSRAVAAIPMGVGGEIVVIADERSTDAHWAGAVAAIERRGITVDSVGLAGQARAAFIGDVRLSAARVGESVRALVDVEGDGRDHIVTVWSSGRRLAAMPAPATAGPATVTLGFAADRAGFLPLRVLLDGKAGMDAVAAIQDPLRVLYLGERQAGAAPLLQRLLGRGFAVEQRDAAAIGRSVDPARFPLVMVDDLPAAGWPAAAQRRVTAAVANAGVGLLASGGKAAFGPGGYAATPMGAALPVVPRQDDRRERPSVALAIVIDSSGSMDGAPLDLAKQVARQTVRKLTAADWVGVVEFYGAKQWAVPMQHAHDTGDVERAIGRMQAEGSSMLFPALQEAYYALKDLDARYKHILVISDGGVAEDRYQQLLRRVADDRINVSTVVVGSDTSGEQSMADWARIGRGRFYSVPDEFGVVAIDLDQPQIKPQPGYRDGDAALAPARSTAWWQGMSLGSPPPLSGYVRVRSRDQADTLVSTASGDPLLASWQYGSGRVSALATELLGEGTRAWRDWPDYGRWLARVAAVTARQRPMADVSIARRFDRATVSVQRLDGGAGAPVVRLVGADGRPVGPPLDAEQRAPGLFVAEFPVSSATPVLIEARDGDGVARGADRPFSDVADADAMPARLALPLARLSALAGGWHGEDALPRSLPAARGRGLVAADLWPWLALLSLMLYLLDIWNRRRPARHGARPIR